MGRILASVERAVGSQEEGVPLGVVLVQLLM